MRFCAAAYGGVFAGMSIAVQNGKIVSRWGVVSLPRFKPSVEVDPERFYRRLVEQYKTFSIVQRFLYPPVSGAQCFLCFCQLA